jgi:hypothetical protein
MLSAVLAEVFSVVSSDVLSEVFPTDPWDTSWTELRDILAAVLSRVLPIELPTIRPPTFWAEPSLEPPFTSSQGLSTMLLNEFLAEPWGVPSRMLSVETCAADG